MTQVQPVQKNTGSAPASMPANPPNLSQEIFVRQLSNVQLRQERTPPPRCSNSPAPGSYSFGGYAPLSFNSTAGNYHSPDTRQATGNISDNVRTRKAQDVDSSIRNSSSVHVSVTCKPILDRRNNGNRGDDSENATTLQISEKEAAKRKSSLGKITKKFFGSMTTTTKANSTKGIIPAKQEYPSTDGRHRSGSLGSGSMHSTNLVVNIFCPDPGNYGFNGPWERQELEQQLSRPITRLSSAGFNRPVQLLEYKPLCTAVPSAISEMCHASEKVASEGRVPRKSKCNEITDVNE